MYQIIPMRGVALGAAWAAISLFFLLSSSTSLGSFAQARIAVLVVNGILIVLTLKPVWRFLWRKLPFLESWFPDLNGQYDVELHHNWPIQQRMLDAAAGGEHFDPRLPNAVKPPLGITKLRASIDLGFYSVRVKMWADVENEAGTVIDGSRTLAAALLRQCDGQPHRLAYIYQQKNRRDRHTITDDSIFEGAAMLNIPNGNFDNIRGEYWTNRAWHQGLSTAGIITFKRRGNGDCNLKGDTGG